MQPIYPVCYETVNPLIGRKVCAVTHDGTHYYGTVSEVSGGRVLLTECEIGDGTLTLASAKTGGKIKKTNSKKNAKLSGFYGGYGYGGYGYGGYWLDLALITTLFLLPFFFI
ncbi:hypothetical protein [Paenibacillus harenae]|uniref:hypothetical protein n=1 Tax=Paenibacillus harenae TaxID=306543 RepID=UPI00041C0676|nr:hypothetical protein [Paenibacillus harenae]